jgi:hypothetical protein
MIKFDETTEKVNKSPEINKAKIMRRKTVVDNNNHLKQGSI